MEPRLAESKKWTELPSELTQQIKDIVSKHFAGPLTDKKVNCKGRIYNKELLLKVTIVTPNQLRQDNFFASFDYNKKKDNVLKLVHLAIDCIGSMLDQFFSDEDVQLPLDWHKFELETKEVHLQYTTDNDSLSNQADRLLGETADGPNEILKGDDPEEDISNVKKIMGITDED